MKRLLILLGAATALFFAGSWIVVATLGNQNHGWQGVLGGVFWFGFLGFAALFVVAALAALVRARLGRAAATTALLTLAVAAAGWAGGTGSQPQLFTVYSANVADRDAPTLVEGSGAIHGIGSATAKDDSTSTTVPLTFSFAHGKLFLRARDVFSWKPDPATCTATEDSRGPYRIVGGTGAYRGATGGGTFVEHGAAIGVRAANGTCVHRFRINYVVATLRGTLTR